MIDVLTHFLMALSSTVTANLGLVGVYVILALGLNMINGMGGMFSIGHAGFWAIGAYVAGAIITHAPIDAAQWWQVAGIVLVSMVAAVAVTALAGLVLAVPCLRLAGDYLAIATLGFSIIVVTLLYNIDFVGAATGLNTPTYVSPWFIWVMVGVTLVFYYRIQFSDLGRRIQALREDEIASQSIGINRVQVKTLVFVLGAALAGVAGALYASSATYLNPSGFEFDQSIKILTMVVLGGLGSITGVTVSAIVLTLLPEVLRLLDLADYQMLIFAVLLIVMVLLRPQGVMGHYEIWDLPLLRKFWRPDGTHPEVEKETRPSGAPKGVVT
jgi:branched-chain amino acid transport system permease protein